MVLTCLEKAPTSDKWRFLQLWPTQAVSFQPFALRLGTSIEFSHESAPVVNLHTLTLVFFPPNFFFLNFFTHNFVTSDDMEANASTFMLEMVEVQNILQNCTCQSLAIIDELGRGTSSSDGVGIAWSVSEYLIGTGVLTLFATHFLQLLQLENLYVQCKVMFLQYDVSSKDIQYRYTMKEGRKDEEGYGIKTARAAGFPESVLSDAEKSRSAVMRFNGELQSTQVFILSQHFIAKFDFL